MKKKHIYIPIEILVREINPKILFSFKASLKNYRVYIGTKTGINKIIEKKLNQKKRGGIYFYKSQIISNRSYVNKVKNSCERFAVLDEELGVAVANIKPTLERRGKNLNEIDKFFVIGKSMMKNLIKFNPYFKKISYISGWIKYDIYKKKNLNIFSSEINDIKKKFNNYYLFSSNYGALSEPGLTKRLKKNSNLVKYKNSKNKNNDYFTFKQSISDFKYLKKNLGNFLKLNPDINLIIRPHPADQLSSDWNYFKKFSNVAIISKFDIVPWIIASKGLIHRGCSTAIDATLLNKPTYYFLPGRKVLKSEKNLVYQISKKIKNFNHLKRYNFETNSEKLKILNKEIEKKEPAYNKIISQFNKMKIKKENPIRFSFFEQCMNYSIPFVGNIKLRLVSLMRFQKIIKDPKINKFINKKDLIRKIKSLNILNHKIKVTEVTREVFEIEKI